ncbi:MAG: glutathione S-transferase C-terminal domain-containing protein, partial [Candidatus Methylomirabilis sp.]|nr:glutathione S-transferase C-terminal domain-containing protein [Deltaproteobacteria bacterium]
EYGDEWGVKWMFHYRWTYDADQASGAERIAAENFPGAGKEEMEGAAAMIRGRMVPRLKFVGSSEGTRELIEACFKRALAILEAHFTTGRKYLFGDRPAFADFGLWGQMYELSTDPTPGAIMRRMAPNVLAWIDRMLSPRAEGGFEPWGELQDTLQDLLRDEVGRYFLPWAAVNAEAVQKGASEATLDLPGGHWTQEPQKYAMKSLAALRAKYDAAPEKAQLDAVLRETGCLRWLRG